MSLPAKTCSLLAGAFVSLTLLGSGLALAEGPVDTAAVPSSLMQDYCTAFVDDARKARQSRDMTELQNLKTELDAKLKEVNEKTALLEAWSKQRDAALAVATEQVVKIYKAMDAASAALELGKLDEATASAVLGALDPKHASAILVEMDPKKAALIVAIMAANSNLKKDHKS